jgi:hypothetical protein
LALKEKPLDHKSPTLEENQPQQHKRTRLVALRKSVEVEKKENSIESESKIEEWISKIPQTSCRE